MKKKVMTSFAILFSSLLLLAACGEKSQEDVIEKLETTMDDLEGYKANAEMQMNTGEEAHTFQISIWHKAKDFYRVELDNAEDKKGSQVILKNEDGVFVLTPALDKSFKFQTEWPENSSQPYLYQSLVSDVLKDEESTFETNDDEYIFETKTNYQNNNNLPYQKIHFDKQTYTPKQVSVLDQDKNALVEVSFSDFDLDPSFDEDDFKRESITSAAQKDMPTAGSKAMEDFTVLMPQYTAGSELDEKKEVELDDGKRVLMTYTGEQNFTLIEERRDANKTLSEPTEVDGDIVNLGHSVGALTEQGIEWQDGGVHFYLKSDELTKKELIEVAESVQGKDVK